MAKGSEQGSNPTVDWFFNDWAGGTSILSRHLKGCYMDLLHAQFNNGHISLDEIKTVLGSDFSAWNTLQKKFATDEKGLFYNKRLEKEILKKKSYSKSRKKNLNGSSHMGDGNGIGNGLEKGNEIIYPFQSEEFKVAWSEWIIYRAEEKKKPYGTKKSEQRALMALSEFDEPFACALIKRSMDNGWQGLIFENTQKEYERYKSNHKGRGFSTSELAAAFTN